LINLLLVSYNRANIDIQDVNVEGMADSNKKFKEQLNVEKEP
jgi:hypothetical protein